MAASAFASSLEQDLSCSVCCDIFREPVLLGCGHSFCRECLSRHWRTSPGRRCPVCRSASQHEPLPNRSLRSTCESFLRQRKKAKEEAGAKRKKEVEKLCVEHGLLLEFYCETEGELVCSQCKKSVAHMGHRILPLQKAVKQRKGRLLAATAPLKKRLNSLMYGSAKSPSTADVIKAVVEKCETQIQKDFETLFAFLKEEQKTRLKALRDAGKRETQQATDIIESEVTYLSNRVQEAEEMAQKDDITFLEEFDTIMSSIQHITPESAQCPLETLDMPRRLGNLRYNVWKKMKEVAPYYPVILDPSTPPVGIVISDDLTSVEATPVRDPSSPLSNWFAFVLGSKAFGKGCHAWDVHVGNSLDWMVGVASQRRIPLGLAQSSGFWALQRKKDQYQAYISPDSHIPLKLPFSTPLQVVRIKLLYKWNGSSGHTRKVMFSDAQTGSNFLSFILEGHTGALYPFVCPLGQGAKLRIEPIEVKVEVKETLGFWERKGHDILLYGCIGLLLISCIIILVIAAMKT